MAPVRTGGGADALATPCFGAVATDAARTGGVVEEVLGASETAAFAVAAARAAAGACLPGSGVSGTAASG